MWPTAAANERVGSGVALRTILMLDIALIPLVKPSRYLLRPGPKANGLVDRLIANK